MKPVAPLPPAELESDLPLGPRRAIAGLRALVLANSEGKTGLECGMLRAKRGAPCLTSFRAGTLDATQGWK